ncbi:MAG TPA: hypothetical protein VFD04_00515 [Actinomycetes bacterium]|nr:hypothetical protein [Actinomycetes bacterium]
MDPHPERPRYYVLAYDTGSLRVLAFTGHEHDFTGAVLTLTRRLQQHRDHPEVAVRLLAAASTADLLDRHAELFGRLRFPDPD